MPPCLKMCSDRDSRSPSSRSMRRCCIFPHRVPAHWFAKTHTPPFPSLDISPAFPHLRLGSLSDLSFLRLTQSQEGASRQSRSVRFPSRLRPTLAAGDEIGAPLRGGDRRLGVPSTRIVAACCKPASYPFGPTLLQATASIDAPSRKPVCPSLVFLDPVIRSFHLRPAGGRSVCLQKQPTTGPDHGLD